MYHQDKVNISIYALKQHLLFASDKFIPFTGLLNMLRKVMKVENWIAFIESIDQNNAMN